MEFSDITGSRCFPGRMHARALPLAQPIVGGQCGGESYHAMIPAIAKVNQTMNTAASRANAAALAHGAADAKGLETSFART
jgi:hypothetical protein